jgi:nicotinate-nucleotide adenylyltransferase
MKIGLFFGSYNPVHVGHMIIANFILNHTPLKKVWMIVSPHNPHKQKSSLANDYDRLHLVRLAIGDNDKIEGSDIEFSLPKPSYTIDTLTYLQEKYPKKEFALIMGGDNLLSLPKWKNYEQIIANYEIYVYKRPNYELGVLENHPNIHLLDAPLLSISASYIRENIKSDKSIQYLTPDAVYNYLEETRLYKKLLSNNNV